MDNLLNQFGINFQEDFSLSIFLINIIIASILLYILSRLYIRFGNSMSNRDQLARVLIIVGVTTFLIISIVKSSLALSLGLVGALSIVRFRTAIKEPEELGFFFISIAIGLGLGASQLLPTLAGFIILSLIIVFLNRNKMKGTLTQNIIIELPIKDQDKNSLLDRISSVIKDNSNDITGLQTISKSLSEIENDISITFIDNMTT
jgi:hypothetical protein